MVEVRESYRDYFEQELIISVATTGAHHGKAENPNLPEQPEEIAADVRECEEAGASIVHIHARDEEGDVTGDPDRFQAIRNAIDDYCDDIIVNFTTGIGYGTGPERLRPTLEVDPQPAIATLDMGPLNFGEDTTALNPRSQNRAFAREMLDHGVKPELELFNNGHVTEMQDLIDQDLLAEPYWATVVLGMQTGTPPTPSNLLGMVRNLPPNTEWQCLALSKHQLPLTTMAITLGGHVRVGMEDNIYYRRGELAESNAQLVRRTARIAEELERPIATPTETRRILELPEY